MPYKTHKIALVSPNNKQRTWFVQQCGYARFAYNMGLADFKDNLAEDTFLSTFTLNTRFNKKKREFDWTSAQDQRAGLYGIHNLGVAIKNWVDNGSGFPRFKKRGCRQSDTTDAQSVRVEGKRIRLPKIGCVRMFEALRAGCLPEYCFVGSIIKVTHKSHCTPLVRLYHR